MRKMEKKLAEKKLGRRNWERTEKTEMRTLLKASTIKTNIGTGTHLERERDKARSTQLSWSLLF